LKSSFRTRLSGAKSFSAWRSNTWLTLSIGGLLPVRAA
jgi:hypothetical protein